MSLAQRNDILISAGYDQDAASVKSTSDKACHSDDEFSSEKSRATLELDDYDASVLREEEERENLLTRNGRLGGIKNLFGASSSHLGTEVGGKTNRKQRRKEHGGLGRKLNHGSSEYGELMFEMEEGFKDTSSRSSSSDAVRWNRFVRDKTETKPHRVAWRWIIPVTLLIIALFIVLAFGAYTASSSFRHAQTSPTYSNGTHLFGPTTILISLDGFRADFLHRGLTPTLKSFIASGVSPRYMLPSFPSVTFPNHFTLVTGLYPESHGVVGNSFWDPDLEEEFFYKDPLRSLQPKWWNAEPLWATAENQGARTAVHMWPGSEAHVPPVEPTYVDKFNDSEALTRKMERVLGFLDLPGDLDLSLPEDLSSGRRPQLIAAYVPNVDSDGHKYGPNSTEIRATISDVDSMLAILMDGLYDRNLTEIVNVVVVSDHGMATTSNTRLVQLDDLIDLSLVKHIDGWPLRGLRLQNPQQDVPILYQQLLEESKQSQGFDVYTLDTMPERYHFTNNKRIAPLWVVPNTGWAVVEKTDFDVAEAQATGATYHPMGIHGYDHEHPLMRAIFVARGPAFPHPPNSRVPVFQNIEVYNIICESLGIIPHSNNGTLHLPLKTEGFHDDQDAPQLETSHDPPQGGSPAEEAKPDSIERPDQESSLPVGGHGHNVKQDDPPSKQSGTVAGEQKDEAKSSWWQVVHNQIEKAEAWAKEWAKKIIEKLKDPSKDG